MVLRIGHQEKRKKMWSYEWGTPSAISASFPLAVSPKHNISMPHQYNAMAEKWLVQ